jgi:uncharacterized protein YycO
MKNKLLIGILSTSLSYASMMYDDFDDNTIYEPTILEQLTYLKEMKIASIEYEINSVIRYTTQRVLEPYSWGGSYKWDKYDCSSLVQGAYASIGITIPRTANAQYNTLKYAVKVKDIKAGDLVYYLTNKRRKLPVTHVTMYIGKGKMVEAKSKKRGIIISLFKTKNLVGIRRVIE